MTGVGWLLETQVDPRWLSGLFRGGGRGGGIHNYGSQKNKNHRTHLFSIQLIAVLKKIEKKTNQIK